MRKILFVFLFASLALPACAQQSSPKTTPLKTVAMEPQAVEKLLEKRLTLNFVPGEVVVKMKPAAALRIMPSTELKRLNLEVKREQTSGGEIVYRLPPAMLSTLAKKDAGDRTLAAVKSLKARPDVEYAQPNYIFRSRPHRTIRDIETMALLRQRQRRRSGAGRDQPTDRLGNQQGQRHGGGGGDRYRHSAQS